jgi:hypothetical protein
MAVPQFVTPLQPEPCPVPDDVLGQLYSSPQHNLAEAVSTMPGLQRARLALFCNRRAHLQDLGLSLAATCSEADLVHEGGQMGTMLFSQSREKAGHIREHNARFRRRPISLATIAPSIAVHDSADETLMNQSRAQISQPDQAWDAVSNDCECEALTHL